jgi:hypothetical protein
MNEKSYYLALHLPQELYWRLIGLLKLVVNVKLKMINLGQLTKYSLMLYIVRMKIILSIGFGLSNPFFGLISMSECPFIIIR